MHLGSGGNAPFEPGLAVQPSVGVGLLEELIQRRHDIDMLEIEFSRLAAHFAATDEHDNQGFNTPIDCIRIRCHMTDPAAAACVAVGKNVDRLSESVRSVEAGEIGFGHLVVMARTADALGRSITTASHFKESDLLGKARELSVGKFYYDCQHYRHAADPTGYAAEGNQAVHERSLEITGGADGMVVLKGRLDSAGGAAVRKALEPLARMTGADDKRKRHRRLADALVQLAVGNKPANIQVMTTLETLMGLPGAAAGEMEFSRPVSSRAIERMACDGSIMRVVLDGKSMVIDVGRSTRVVKGWMKTALIARDRGCRWPGGNRSASQCAGHHLIHWIRGGKTELDNMILLCHHHHRLVHEDGWQLVRTEDRRILTIPPTTQFNALYARGPD